MGRKLSLFVGPLFVFVCRLFALSWSIVCTVCVCLSVVCVDFVFVDCLC